MLSKIHQAIANGLMNKRLKESKDKDNITWELKGLTVKQERKRKMNAIRQKRYRGRKLDIKLKKRFDRIHVKDSVVYFNRFKIRYVKTLYRKGLRVYSITPLVIQHNLKTKISIKDVGYRYVKLKQQWEISYAYFERRFAETNDLRHFRSRNKKAWAMIKPWIEVGLI